MDIEEYSKELLIDWSRKLTMADASPFGISEDERIILCQEVLHHFVLAFRSRLTEPKWRDGSQIAKAKELGINHPLSDPLGLIAQVAEKIYTDSFIENPSNDEMESAIRRSIHEDRKPEFVKALKESKRVRQEEEQGIRDVFVLQSPDEYLEDVDVDWIKVICESSYWVSLEAFKIITDHNHLQDSPGVFFPFSIRNQKKNSAWQSYENRYRYLCKNHLPQNAIFLTYAGVGWNSNCGYTCCHIYGDSSINTIEAGRKGFTSVANIILVPRPLKALTDHYAPVMKCLKQISYLRYDWAPSQASRLFCELSDYEEYSGLIKELPVVEDFKSIYKNRLKKYTTACNPEGDEEVAEWKERVLGAS